MILGQIPFVKPGHFTENSSASFMFYVNLLSRMKTFLTDYLDITVVTDAIHVFILDYCCY